MTSLIVVHHRGFTDPASEQQHGAPHGRAYQNPDHLVPPADSQSCEARNCRRLERGTNPVGGSFTSEATT